jgi:hypothetical protein
MIKELLQNLKSWAQNDFLANSESESNRSGYLSYRAEYHSAAWGVSVAILYIVTNNPIFLVGGLGWLVTRAADGEIPGYLPYGKQFAKESLYVLGHAAAVIVLYHGYTLL